jgi:hypothetical protein
MRPDRRVRSWHRSSNPCCSLASEASKRGAGTRLADHSGNRMHTDCQGPRRSADRATAHRYEGSTACPPPWVGRLPGRPPFFDADGSHGCSRAHCASVRRAKRSISHDGTDFREDGKGFGNTPELDSRSLSCWRAQVGIGANDEAQNRSCLNFPCSTLRSHHTCPGSSGRGTPVAIPKVRRAHQVYRRIGRTWRGLAAAAPCRGAS